MITLIELGLFLLRNILRCRRSRGVGGASFWGPVSSIPKLKRTIETCTVRESSSKDRCRSVGVLTCLRNTSANLIEVVHERCVEMRV